MFLVYVVFVLYANSFFFVEFVDFFSSDLSCREKGEKSRWAAHLNIGEIVNNQRRYELTANFNATSFGTSLKSMPKEALLFLFLASSCDSLVLFNYWVFLLLPLSLYFIYFCECVFWNPH